MKEISEDEMLKDGSLTDLLFEKNLSSWQDFLNYLMNREHDCSMLWRGQADASWEVVSSYTRDVEREIKAIVPDESNDYDEKVLRLRRKKASRLSSIYHELLN